MHYRLYYHSFSVFRVSDLAHQPLFNSNGSTFPFRTFRFTMASKIAILTFFLVSIAVANAQRWRTIQVGVGDHCVPGAAPVGPGGSFQVVERGVKKVCAAGTSCRNGACNCDNFRDGTVTGQSVDANGNRACKRVAGQKCSNNGECFQDVQCIRGVCTCPSNKPDFYCVDEKNDIYILA